jgi:hypothetical protein
MRSRSAARLPNMVINMIELSLKVKISYQQLQSTLLTLMLIFN